MEPQFENTTVMDEATWQAATIASYTLHGRKNMRILSAVLYSLGLVALLWLVSRGDPGGQATPFRFFGAAVYIVLIALLWRRSERSIVRRMTRANMKNAASVGYTEGYRFFDDVFITDDGDSHAELKYSALTELAETDGYFLLFQGKALCFVLDKTGFLGGGADRFRAFIGEKCARAVQEIKR